MNDIWILYAISTRYEEFGHPSTLWEYPSKEKLFLHERHLEVRQTTDECTKKWHVRLSDADLMEYRLRFM